MNVLVTRPNALGQELVELLNQQQIFALHQPLFTLEAGRELPILPSLFSQLNAGDYVFAVSKNAIDFACNTLAETGFKFRRDLQYFSVGMRTANYFAEKSEQAVKFPIHFENSEGVLELPEMHTLKGKNLLILRADSGRELLAQEAVKRGAIVQNVECYRRVLISDQLAEKISLAKRSGIDTIVITSGQILATLVEQTAVDDQSWLFECQVVVVGERIATLAKQYGWERDRIIVSQKADNQTLLDVLVNNKR